ncbi:SH3 domain-containing protein [Streptomyces sp. NPDC002659]|uniref:SH3 domain-containing protein n=1 Tax=Streptomyces sp. NPDC002659 TaxID=3364656 RepID=UPI0036866E4C
MEHVLPARSDRCGHARHASLAIAPAARAQTSTQAQAGTCADIREVTGSGVNVRTGGGTTYRAIGSLYRGDQGRRIGSSGSWGKLRGKLRLIKKSRSASRPGTTGWVSRRYAEECVPTQLD